MALRPLEVDARLVLHCVGFVLSGAALPLGLKHKPYCSKCYAYMMTKELGRALEQDDRGRSVHEAGHPVRDLCAAVQSQDAEGRRRAVQEFQAQGAGFRRHDRILVVDLVSCRICHQGAITISIVEHEGRRVSRMIVDAVSVPSDAIREVRPLL